MLVSKTSYTVTEPIICWAVKYNQYILHKIKCILVLCVNITDIYIENNYA